MPQERKIIPIPPKFEIFSLFKRVAIYCRVSTNHTAQEESLKAQIDRYQKMVETRFDWKLVKTYSDTASGSV